MTGYPMLSPRSGKAKITRRATHNKNRIMKKRVSRQPRFMRLRLFKSNCLGSSGLCGSVSGLWRASSFSTRSGERSEPQDLGSGDREYCTQFKTVVYGPGVAPPTLSVKVLRRELARG